MDDRPVDDRDAGATSRLGIFLTAALPEPGFSVELSRIIEHLILGREALEEGDSDGSCAEVPEEFRREAVALYRSSDRSRAEVAKSLGISDGSLAAWVKDLERGMERGRWIPTSGPSWLGFAQENAELRQDREILRKRPPISPGDDPVSCFRFVDDHRTDHPVKRLCQLVEIPRSSFYAWAGRPLSALRK